jgi:hypothetical protein
MKIENLVKYAIEDFQAYRFDSALLFACIAVDGTARKLFGTSDRNSDRYKKFINKYIFIIQCFTGGVDLVNTPWNVALAINEQTAKVTCFADIVYNVIRCNQTHGDEIPNNIDFSIDNSDGKVIWRFDLEQGNIIMPQQILWGLLSSVVFCKANTDLRTNTDHYLTWQHSAPSSKVHKFMIKDSWGQENEIISFLQKFDHAHVKMNF